MKIEIKNRYTGEVIISGNYESIKDCLEKNSANLHHANLRFADLHHANLSSAKNYLNHHEVFQEIIRQQSIKTFTSSEWSTIGQILVHRLCWDVIKNKYKASAMRVFKKLSKAGFDEWEKYFTNC